MLKRKFLLVAMNLAILSLSLQAQVPLIEFVVGIGGTDRYSGASIVTDSFGNVYVAGLFEGTVDFDPGEDIYNLTSKGNIDIYLLKLDIEGNLLWAHAIGESQIDDISHSNALTIDKFNNIYLTGGIMTSVDENVSTCDMFVQKRDTDGNLLWEHSIQGANNTSITTNASGDLYIAGSFSGLVEKVDFDPGVGTFYLPYIPSSSAFVLKLTSSGIFLWATTSGGFWIESLTTDASGNVYVTGVLPWSSIFDPGGENISSTPEDDQVDFFVQKLDLDGVFKWVKIIRGSSTQASSITTDVLGNVLVTGRFSDAVDFDPGEGKFIITSPSNWNCFLLKLDKDGNFLWAKANKIYSGNNHCIGNDITTDASGNVYVVGNFDETVDFDPSQDSLFITAQGGIDFFVQKLDSEGKLLWVKSFGNYMSSGYSITTDILDNVYITGNFEGTMDFDPGKGTFELTAVGQQNSTDAFILKLSQCTPTANVPDVAQLEDLKAECVVEMPAAPTASNNCGEVFSATTEAIFPITTPGTTLITWTFSDPHGHIVTQPQKVIIEDITAPVPDLAQLENLYEQCALDTAIAPTATDNCGKVYTGVPDVSFPITAAGTTLIIWTFEDDAGNITTQSQKVILEDTIAPMPDLEHLPDVVSQCTAAMPAPPTATDNCDQILTATTTVEFPITTPGTTVVEWIFEDSNGNTTTQTQNIIIEEAVVPAICMVTVDEETSRNMLSWSNDAENVESFGIYRETNIANEYALIEYVKGELINTYIDQQSFPAQKSNRYKITAIDSCGFESDMSTFHKSIHLTINKGIDNSWNLIWDGYEGISFGTYRIYRAVGEQRVELLTEIASNLNSFTDTEAPAGRIAYQIEVLNPNPCGTATKQRTTEFISSKSNIARSSIITDIGDAANLKSIVLYPNPANDQLKIDKGNKQEINVYIWNSSGKLISSFTSKQQVTYIDMSGYAPGVYLVKVNDQISRKIVKE